jgi:3-oxoacyl-ACP reductase-like protein
MNFQYFSAGKNQTLSFHPLSAAAPSSSAASAHGPIAARRATAAAPMKSSPKASALHKTLSAVKAKFNDLKSSCNGTINESDSRYMLTPDGQTLMIATDSITVQGVKKADIRHLRDKYGFEEVREGSQGKLLLRSQETNLGSHETGPGGAEKFAQARGCQGHGTPAFRAHPVPPRNHPPQAAAPSGIMTTQAIQAYQVLMWLLMPPGS